jgi:beta-lactamase regulating signal transducer with metallopeptidase domain
MTSDLALPAVAVLLTYLAHSSLLLCGAWLIDTLVRNRSHALREWLWKTAAVAPLATATLTFACQWSNPLLEWTLGADDKSLAAAARDELPESSRPRPNEPAFHTAAVPEAGDVPPTVSELVIEDSLARVARSEPPATESSPRFESMPMEDAVEPTSIAVRAEMEMLLGAESAANVAPSNSIAKTAWRLIVHAGGTLIGIVVLLGLLIVLLRWARLARSFVSATAVAEGPARTALDRLRRRARLWRSVRVLESPQTREPLAFGIFRWTIVLPMNVERQLSRRELEALLAHELAHLVRGDVTWLWIGQFLCTCLAFQPLNFLARRRWQSAAEFQCDDWALGRGVRPLVLANCLAEVASWRIEDRLASVSLSATGSNSEVARRIRRLADGCVPPDRWSSRRRRWLLAALSLAATAALAIWAPRAAWPERRWPERRLETESPITAPAARTPTQVVATPAAEASRESDPELVDQWQDLDRELRGLNESLLRLSAALSREPGDPELSALAEQLSRRASLLESRRLRLITRVSGDELRTDASSFDLLDSPEPAEPDR